jgi:hypothetical protein
MQMALKWRESALEWRESALKWRESALERRGCGVGSELEGVVTLVIITIYGHMCYN